MVIRIVSFTEKGAEIEHRLCKEFGEFGHTVESYAKYPSKGLKLLDVCTKDFTEKSFKVADSIIFIGAMGIAVRSIAPFIKSKTLDPAVVVVDELGKYVVPVISGHIGGGNRLATVVADILGATPVITTATDLNNVFAVDVWATENHVHINNPAMIKTISAALLRGEEVGFFSDYPVTTSLPFGLVETIEFETGISLSHDPNKTIFKETLRLTGKDYFIGVGCRMGVEYSVLEQEFDKFLEYNHIAPERVRTLASINFKSKEKALLQLAENRRLEFVTYSAPELNALEGNFTSSNFVRNVTGTDNVCERAACMASGLSLTVSKYRGRGVTFAASHRPFECEF